MFGLLEIACRISVTADPRSNGNYDACVLEGRVLQQTKCSGLIGEALSACGCNQVLKGNQWLNRRLRHRRP